MFSGKNTIRQRVTLGDTEVMGYPVTRVNKGTREWGWGKIGIHLGMSVNVLAYF